MTSEGPRQTPSSRLRSIRQQEGLKVVELSRLAGVSTTAIRDLETQRRDYSVELKHKIIHGLNANARRRKEWTYADVF